MDELSRKKLVENQKGVVRVGQLPILPSKCLKKTLKKETLRVTSCRSVLKRRQAHRYNKILVAREIPAGRWGC